MKNLRQKSGFQMISKLKILKYKNQKGITTKEQNNGESSEINNERKIQFKSNLK